eukprot:1688999-Alexandrium_andersonii.AAC.1
MCIRDRNRTFRDRPPAGPSGPWDATPGSSSRDWAWPVSRVPGALRDVAFGPSMAANSSAWGGSASM